MRKSVKPASKIITGITGFWNSARWGSSNNIKENIDLRGEIKIEKEGRWHICKARNQ